jgi:hypothetical protein
MKENQIKNQTNESNYENSIVLSNSSDLKIESTPELEEFKKYKEMEEINDDNNSIN